MAGGASQGSLLLEEPLIRTPYELLRRSHRSAQRQVEKDFNAVQSVLNGLLKGFDDKPISQAKREAVNAKLDQGVERIKGLKRKLDDLQPTSAKPGVLRARLQYLDAVIASGATDREVEVKIEPPEPNAAGKEGGMDVDRAEDKPKVENIKTEMTEMDVDVKPQPAAISRAASPIAPEPVHEDKNVARYLVDYLLRQGYVKTAKAVTSSAAIEQLVDMKLFAELVRIETALVEKQSVTEALAWCGENRGTLKKTKNNLEFTLRLQEYIELCRKRDIDAAIAYSRKNLAPWAGSHMLELQQGMTLLAFGEKTGVGLYRKLYDRSRWASVRDHFRETFLSLYALPSQPLLCLSTHAGLSALRLPCCAPDMPNTQGSPSHAIPLSPALPSTSPLSPTIAALIDTNDRSLDEQARAERAVAMVIAQAHQEHRAARQQQHQLPDDDEDDSRTVTGPLPTGETPMPNVDCPTCGKHLKVLAANVPMSHHVNSTIVCRISGEVMDSQNEPMAFPNGQVYSSKALREMAKNNFDVVTCPRTKQSCPFARLKKVYIS